MKVDGAVVYNTLGMAVRSIPMAGEGSRTSIDLNGLPSGNYFVALLSDSRVVGMKKLVKQ